MTEPKSVVLPLHHGSIPEPGKGLFIWSAKLRVASFPPKWFLNRNRKLSNKSGLVCKRQLFETFLFFLELFDLIQSTGYNIAHNGYQATRFGIGVGIVQRFIFIGDND